jgi:co-chaperonin GroES (HSP10)
MQAELTELERKEQQLVELVQEVYAMSAPQITPIHPWILVRIMPKEQKFGILHLPDKQNKVFYEGIVLATWKPFWRKFNGKLTSDDGHALIEKEVYVQSHVKIGERVMFMHFEGQPVPYLDEKNYRMVHEYETHPNGGVWATIEHKQDTGLREKLNELFKDHASVTISGK